jgi:hypothetical protein
MAENANSHRGEAEGWVSRFGEAPALPPDSSWSQEQRERDNYQINLLAQRRRITRDSHLGELVIADSYYAISRTTIASEKSEILPGCALGYAVLGGFVTYEEALIEFPQAPGQESSSENLPVAA